MKNIQLNNLPEVDQLNHLLFHQLLDDEIAELGFKPYRLPISRCAGFHLTFPDMFTLMQFSHVQDYENYISRLSDFKRYTLENIELMRLGLRTGYLPPRCTLQDIDQQFTAQIVTDPQQSPLYHPFKQFPDSMGESLRNKLRESAGKAILSSVVTAYQALRQFVQHEYLPAS